MRIIDVFSMCFRNLIKRKLRTFLTLLGVMIGTGSIILMISLGLATDEQFAQMIEDMDMDMTVINVYPQWGGMSFSSDGSMMEMEQKDITDADADAIARLPHVRVATPMMRGELVFKSGPYIMIVWEITGIRPSALALMDLNMVSGHVMEDGADGYNMVWSTHSERGFFDPSAYSLNDRWSGMYARMWEDEVETLVDIYNDPIQFTYDRQSFWNSLYGGGDDDYGMDLADAMTPVRYLDFEITGVYEPTQQDIWYGRGNTIYIDIEALQTLSQLGEESARKAQEEDEWWPHFSALQGGPRQTYNELFIRVDSPDNTKDVAEIIRDMGFQVYFQGEYIDMQREMQRGIQTLLAAIAFVSLAVAAINIANTMITSVTERSREIGIMKVIGASISDILKLFLLEATVIGLLGGVFGIAIALGFSYAMNNFDIEFINNLNMGAPIMTEGMEGANVSVITPWLCGVALAVAGGVGIVSGFFPAWRATRMSALAAIRGD